MFLNSHSQAIPFYETKNITNTSSDSYRAQVLVDDENLYVVWTESIGNNSEVFFTKSSDQGKTFVTPKNISNNEGDSAFPRISAQHGKIFISWYDYSPGQSDVFVARSLDDGNTFEVLNLSNNQKASYNPWLSKTENHLYVTWTDGGRSKEVQLPNGKKIADVLTGDSEILFAHSADNGASYKITNISNKNGDSLNPRLKAVGGNVYITWMEDDGTNSEIFFSTSHDGGATFSEPINVSNSDLRSYDSGIAVDGDFVYLVWKEDLADNTAILFSRSIDNGKTFEKPIKLSTGQSSITRDTQIALDAQNVYVVYHTEDEENSHVFVAVSNDNGASFGQPINLDWKNGKSEFAQVHIAGKTIYVVWTESISENSDVFLRTSNDNTTSFGPLVNISNDSANSGISILGPQIASSKSNTFIVWENKTQSELYLTAIPFQDKMTSKNYVLSLQSMLVNVEMDAKSILPNKTIPLRVSFYDLKGDPVKNIRYAIVLKDDAGNVVEQKNYSSDSGMDFINVSFMQEGTYQMAIQVPDHVELELSDDQAILVHVVPEFSNGMTVLALLILSPFFYMYSQRKMF
jgi:hypothetical protein